jgi:hemerythrin
VEKFFQWRQDWVLGIQDLDEQHKALVECINKLAPQYMRVIENPKSDKALRQKLTGLLQVLYGDIERHFRDEEKMMQEAAYPDYKNHAHEHVMLLAELKNYCNCINNRDEELDMETLCSLKTWFITHILDDRKFASHFHATRTGDIHTHPRR